MGKIFYNVIYSWNKTGNTRINIVLLTVVGVQKWTKNEIKTNVRVAEIQNADMQYILSAAP